MWCIKYMPCINNKCTYKDKHMYMFSKININKLHADVYTCIHKLHTDVYTDIFSIVNHIKFPLPEQILLSAHQNLSSLETLYNYPWSIQLWKWECADLSATVYSQAACIGPARLYVTGRGKGEQMNTYSAFHPLCYSILMMPGSLYSITHGSRRQPPCSGVLSIVSPIHRHGKLSLGLVIYFQLQSEKQAAVHIIHGHLCLCCRVNNPWAILMSLVIN